MILGIITYTQQLKAMTKKDNILKAGKGKILYYLPEEIIWGKTARLAEYKGHQLDELDFIEINQKDVVEIDGIQYVFRNKSYADIKTFIIKLHYSNDEQIAIMLNNDEDKYNEMQQWREFATNIAKKVC